MKVDLYFVKGATLKDARRVDHKEQDFAKSARLYYSVFVSTPIVEEKVWAFGGLLLQLANAGAFVQVKRLARVELPKLLKVLPIEKRYFLGLDVQEKLGRVEFSQKHYRLAIKHFALLEKRLQKKSRKIWTLEEQKAFSTAEHFLGLSLMKLAELGMVMEDNLCLSRKHLETAIKMDKKIRGSGVDETLGFGYKSIAENYLIEEDLVKANKAIEKAKRYFIKYTKSTPKSNILVHYHEVKGKILVKQGREKEAEVHFSKAQKIKSNLS